MDNVGLASLDRPMASVRHQDAERRLDAGVDVRHDCPSSTMAAISREGVLIAIDAPCWMIGVAIDALVCLHAKSIEPNCYGFDDGGDDDGDDGDDGGDDEDDENVDDDEDGGRRRRR